MELSNGVRARFMRVDPAAIGHQISGGFMRKQIKPVDDAMKVVGPAFTVRLPERDSSALYCALQKAPKGSVIVVDCGSDDTFACCGEFLATMAMHRGMAGIVVDGPATDKLALKEMGFPVFCDGFSPVTSNVTGTSGEFGVSIACGGAVVDPGSIILGDADGVIIVPGDYETLLKSAEEYVANEAVRRKAILEEGYRYVQREDYDPVAFFESNVLAKIAALKKPKSGKGGAS